MEGARKQGDEQENNWFLRKTSTNFMKNMPRCFTVELDGIPFEKP